MPRRPARAVLTSRSGRYGEQDLHALRRQCERLENSLHWEWLGSPRRASTAARVPGSRVRARTKQETASVTAKTVSVPPRPLTSRGHDGCYSKFA